MHILVADDHEYFAQPHIAAPHELFPALTERERKILVLLARGQRNAEIALALTISPKTVSNYVASICAKLQAADRAEAIVRAREAGLR